MCPDGSQVSKITGADGAHVVFKSSDDGTERTLTEHADVVINCSGSAGLSLPNPSPLIDNLLTSGLCQANASGAGFVVNDKMEAADDLFVIGPFAGWQCREGSLDLACRTLWSDHRVFKDAR